MAHIISVVNHKGGVGKTTTAVNVAACLAEMGRKVLLVDIDPQGSASISCGVLNDGNDLLKALQSTWTLPLHATSVDGLSLVPSGPGLSTASERFNGSLGRGLLARSLSRTDGDWGYVIIDCPPSITVLTQSALQASRHVMIPVEASHLGLTGLGQIAREVEAARRNNKSLEILAIVPCRAHPRRRMHIEVMMRIEGMFPGKVSPMVRESVALAECPGRGLPIITHAPRGNGADDYRKLAGWVDERIGTDATLYTEEFRFR